MQVGNGFEAGVDGAADFGFALGLGREIAVVRVADQTILETEVVEGLGEAGGQGNDAVYGLRDAHGAAGFEVHGKDLVEPSRLDNCMYVVKLCSRTAASRKASAQAS